MRIGGWWVGGWLPVVLTFAGLVIGAAWWPVTLALPACSLLLWLALAVRALVRRWHHGDRSTG